MSREQRHGADKPSIGPGLQAVGPLLLWLRQYYVLLGVTSLGAVVAVIAPFFLADPSWAPVRIAAGVAAALAIVADRLADNYEKKLSAITFKNSERDAERSVEFLNILLSEAIEVTFLKGKAREEAINTLQRTLARCASGSIGDGTRATYYRLRRVSGGKRILGQPVHGIEHGRYDKPDRPFEEHVDPDHEIWNLMDRADEEPEVRSHPEAITNLDWEAKKYRTFFSVPVKANSVQLGFLSVNNSQVGSIGGPQRATVLAMARTMALVMAHQKGPDALNTQVAKTGLSVASSSVSSTPEEVTQ